MEITLIISSILILIGAVFIFVSVLISKKIEGDVLPDVRSKWHYIVRLMKFFFAGYLFFLIVLWSNLEISLELVAAGIFLGGAIFVFLVIKLSRYTIGKINNSEDALSLVNEEIKRKNLALENEIQNCKLKEEQISFMAYFDGLTSLPNRILFLDRLKQAITYAHRNEELVGILFIDLDSFKRINDTLGHRTGDLLLKDVAERLIDNLRKMDTIARQSTNTEEDTMSTVGRLGGDEFIVLLAGLKREENAARAASRILSAISESYMLDNHEIFVTASIGISLYPTDSEDADDLIKNADIAMFKAKEHGKNSYAYYKKSMNEKSLKRLGMENKLRRALDREEFILCYQPQLDIVSGEITGMEALIRWEDPDLGLVSPLEFIPLAEETGLIIPIGEWVLHTACLHNMHWQKAGMKPVSTSVNISSQQFKKKDLARTIVSALENSGLSPGHLIVEITESLMMQNLAETTDKMHELRERGIRFEVDDFGTGYSSLSYLKRFPLHAVKVDRSFVKEIPGNADDKSIIKAIIAMAHNLNLKVVAEGVEREDQLSYLVTRGCDRIQGYLLDQPVTVQNVSGLISNGKSRMHNGLATCKKILTETKIKHNQML